MNQPRSVAVVGAGWAGLAAAVRASEAGHAVTLFEMAGQLGGRARNVEHGAAAVDNGQHILIGAYLRTLALMRTVGADPDALLLRMPLSLVDPAGRGLALAAGHPVPAFVRAVLRCRGWSWGDRMALLGAAGAWAARRFRCAPGLTVAALCRGLPPTVRRTLIDPLCVAALNTAAEDASARVLLRVLRDALFSAPGSADLLLPRRPLGALLPEPAARWLHARGARLRLRSRVQRLAREGRGWTVDGEHFDGVVLASTAQEAARLVGPLSAAWAATAAGLRYEPIVSVVLHAPGARLPAPMTALHDGPDAPAQFAFDHGALCGADGTVTFVVSGARRWVEAGLDATAQAVLRQAEAAFAPGTWPEPPRIVRVLAEKRATFACTPLLARPPMAIAPGLVAAGDYIAGPYPATLEGAVRSGEAAVLALTATPGTRRH